MVSRMVFACSLFFALTAGASAATVEVRVSGVAAGKGKVNVALCDKERFLKQCGYSGSAPAKGAETVVTLKDIPAGTWAVLAYQDENENNELDRSFIGVPKENYGFSRDARGKFGPPGFEDAAIEVKDGTTVAPVKLK
ncbi:DUF2141 domain-containing protein [Massilia sp. YIM B02769]|nr:DUF2141 domain-containing protein [Massilia sp. YIM B02769]